MANRHEPARQRRAREKAEARAAIAAKHAIAIAAAYWHSPENGTMSINGSLVGRVKSIIIFAPPR